MQTVTTTQEIESELQSNLYKLEEVRLGASQAESQNIKSVQNYMTQSVAKIIELQRLLINRQQQVSDLSKELGEIKNTAVYSHSQKNANSLFSTPKSNNNSHDSNLAKEIIIYDSLVPQPTDRTINNTFNPPGHTFLTDYYVAQPPSPYQSPQGLTEHAQAIAAGLHNTSQILSWYCDQEQEHLKTLQEKKKAALLKQHFSPIAEVPIEDGSTVKKEVVTREPVLLQRPQYDPKDNLETKSKVERKLGMRAKRYNYLEALEPYLQKNQLI